MSGFNATPVDGSTPPIPMGSVISPGDKTPRPLRGGPESTDSQGNILADVATYTYDGENETLGGNTNLAVTGDTAGTLSAKMRGLVKILTDVWDATNHRLHVIVDNATSFGQAAMNASMPVVIASNQTPLVMATPTITQVTSSATSETIIATNVNRKGLLIFNDSTTILYLLYGTGAASATNYSVKINPQALWEMPTNPVYTGAFDGIWSSANGFAYVTEII